MIAYVTSDLGPEGQVTISPEHISTLDVRDYADGKYKWVLIEFEDDDQ